MAALLHGESQQSHGWGWGGSWALPATPQPNAGFGSAFEPGYGSPSSLKRAACARSWVRLFLSQRLSVQRVPEPLRHPGAPRCSRWREPAQGLAAGLALQSSGLVSVPSQLLVEVKAPVLGRSVCPGRGGPGAR